VWSAGTPIVRVHPATYRPDQFNHGTVSGRFRPFAEAGATVPTMYGADDFRGALSETVFHDLPRPAAGQVISHAALYPFVHSQVVPMRDLSLVQLAGYGLDRLVVTREQLIMSGPEEYDWTARWGEALYHCERRPDGLLWVSRQYELSRAVMLFQTRVASDELTVDYLEVAPLWTGQGLADVMQAAAEAGITIST
jgi:RES domain